VNPAITARRVYEFENGPLDDGACSRRSRVVVHRLDSDRGLWTDTLKLHQAIAGSKLGGVGPGVSPKTALSVGLKVDVDAVPAAVAAALKAGKVDLDDPASTLVLLKANAVVGITGRFGSNGQLSSVGGAGTDNNSGKLHAAAETGVDGAYAARTANKAYRTTPLRALWQHPPYFHDGSADTLADVVAHYNRVRGLGLTAEQQRDLVEYLKSL
jgi:hypothetical protein